MPPALSEGLDIPPPESPLRTCRGITTPNTFFSLSDRMYLMKAQPEPISAMVMNRSAPFSLGTGVS